MRLMKSVARRVALNLSEAKRYTTLNEAPLPQIVGSTNYNWAYKNVFAPIPSANGSAAGTSWAIAGNEIVDPLVKLNITFSLNYFQMVNALNTAAYSSTYMYVYLVACNEQVSGTVPPSNTWTRYPTIYAVDDPGWFLNQNPARVVLNGNNVKVIRKWRRKHTPDELLSEVATTFGSFGRPAVDFRCKHWFRGKKTFEDQVFADTDSNFLRSAILRGWNFYWLVGWGVATGTLPTAQQPTVVADTYTYFKDP